MSGPPLTNGREICSRWFDDLQVGDAFETHGRTVTEFDVIAFGALTGDTNPQHFDRRFGERGPFGERIAHGALIVSFALALVPIDPDRLVALRRLSEVKFKRPLRIGDTIRVRARIARCLSVDGDVGRVVLAADILNQEDLTVTHAELETLWRRSPGDSAVRRAPLGIVAPPPAEGLHDLPGIPL
jgi:3-hydroxybutyryl-CoA dehydratase